MGELSTNDFNETFHILDKTGTIITITWRTAARLARFGKFTDK